MNPSRIRNLEQLRIFHAVAQTLSMTRASDDLALTQPAVSNSIARLEASLECPLFERTTRRMILTSQGERLEAAAARIFKELDTAASDIDAITSGSAGILRLGTTSMLSQLLVLPSLDHFMDLHGGVRSRIGAGSAMEVVAKLKTREVDASFLPGSYLPAIFHGEDTALQYTEVIRTGEVFVASTNWSERLSGVSSLEELARLPLITGAAGSAKWHHQLEIFEKNGIRPHIAVEVKGINVVVDLLENGRGFCVLPEIYCNSLIASGRHLMRIPLREALGTVSCGYLVRRSETQPPVLSRFLEAVKRQAACLQTIPTP